MHWSCVVEHGIVIHRLNTQTHVDIYVWIILFRWESVCVRVCLNTETSKHKYTNEFVFTFHRL